MEVKVEKQPKSTIKLTIKVPNDKVKDMYQHVLEEFAKNAEIHGFRKGKAPLHIVEKNVKEGELNGEVINHLLQEYYVAALKEHLINPLGNPKVLIKEFQKDKDFEFEATVAVKPEVKLTEYKTKLKQLHLKKNIENKEEKQTLTMDDVISAISNEATVEVSDILVEEEVTRMLSRLLQQAETLGLSIDQYLAAQNKTAEQLKKEYEDIATKNIKSEFALSKAIEDEKIKVEDTEIEEAIAAVPDENIRTKLQKGADRWYIISILAKNKLIKKLLDEIEGTENNDSKASK